MKPKNRDYFASYEIWDTLNDFDHEDGEIENYLSMARNGSFDNMPFNEFRAIEKQLMNTVTELLKIDKYPYELIADESKSRRVGKLVERTWSLAYSIRAALSSNGSGLDSDTYRMLEGLDAILDAFNGMAEDHKREVYAALVELF